MKNLLMAAVALFACVACSQSTQSTSTASSASPQPAPTNATGFPLFAHSRILTSKVWNQQTGSHQYSGLEVVAQTPASLAALDSWLHGLSANPPPGFTVGASGNDVSAARQHARALGVDFQVFDHTVDGKHHALIVLAIDPVAFDKKAGPVLGMIGKYRMLPQALRDPIDQQVKAHTGFTVSEALAPNTPIGAALAAVNQLRSTGDRGVVLVDGAKR